MSGEFKRIDINETSGLKIMSSLQLKNELRNGDNPFLALLLEIKSDLFQKVLDQVADVLLDFVDVMLAALSKERPPQHPTDHD